MPTHTPGSRGRSRGYVGLAPTKTPPGVLRWPLKGTAGNACSILPAAPRPADFSVGPNPLRAKDLVRGGSSERRGCASIPFLRAQRGTPPSAPRPVASNAEAERIFSFVGDVKNKKRNHLGNDTLSAICLTRSSFQADNINCVNFEIDSRHLELHNSANLYTTRRNDTDDH
ncbi:hypothetical protein ALC57_10308 [Trachymyrmex cornetzi]|uniref:HAT C-terminal dimerisation domain-containing protein n=1 Tax=Trachymyrmex cornetzi TaxID=471704 RepID=A0A151J484_9HYME|nr:hypothetical protein ALC57_10308 [Trachymyrmex cornetzi]